MRKKMLENKHVVMSNLRKANIFIDAVVFVIFCLFLANRSGRFNKEPKVNCFADNCYNETFIVITDEDYRPYSFYDSQNKFSGHDVELINMIANDMKMNVDLKFMSWNEGIKEVTGGNAQLLMTCDYSDSFPGVENLIKSESISSDEFIVYSKKPITSSDVLYGKRIGIMKNGNVKTEINRMQLSKYCIEYKDNRQAMQALIDDEVDYTIMRQTVGTVLLSELKAKKIKGYISIGRSYMCFGINENNPELVKKVNHSLEKLKMNGELDKLRNKWLTTFVKPYSLIELLTNNIWFIFIFFILVLITLTAFFKTRMQREKVEEERSRNSQVVEHLTQDFICVNYIEITDNAQQDPVINYRVSEKLKELIPGWEEEKTFSHKLDLLRDNLVYEPDRSQFDENVKRTKVINALKESGVYFVNTRLFIDDEIKYYQMKFSPVFEKNNIKGMVAGLHTVDEQTKKEMALQNQLQNALDNAEVANRAKTEFLFNMSHDIRTPLNAISGFTNMAIKYIDEKDKALDCLKKTQQSGKLLLSLINSVLDVSRIESGKAMLEEQLGDICFTFANIKATMTELAVSKGIDLSFDFKNIINRYVLCDFNRCNRVFVNIISNAIKYSNKGGYVKAICEQIESNSDDYASYKFTFEDNGIGMSEDFQKHAFEKFAREKNVTISGIQGTGLGLSVCKSFVELMNGTIECRSKVGEGTVFTVILPFKLQKDQNKTDLVADFLTPETRDTMSFKGKRLLLAEDNELNLEIAVDILTDAEFVVESVKDGTEAVQILKEKGADYYDFILMDIQMPIMSGYEATREIRKLYPEKRIPIIALSANAFAEDKAASLAAGMDEHVAKPINIEKLFSVLSRFL